MIFRVILLVWEFLLDVLAVGGWMDDEKELEILLLRQQRQHLGYHKPELLAVSPNQVWGWDITKQRGPAKWTHFAWYTVLDIVSGYVVGWMIAEHESAALAKQLIATAAANQQIQPDQLTLHADTGKLMKAKTLALLWSDLGVNQSHSRPYVSDDNPFSEAQFKTLKYRPDYPDRFGCIQDAAPGPDLFSSGTTPPTTLPASIYSLRPVPIGPAQTIRRQRQPVLAAAYAQHPQRFVRGEPIVKGAPDAVWINSPIGPNLP